MSANAKTEQVTQSKPNQGEQANLSQQERLKALKGKRKNSAMTPFESLAVVKLLHEPQKYYPILKSEDGVTLKDEDGKVLRSKEHKGWVFTLVCAGTEDEERFVKIVLDKKYDLEPLVTYVVGGNGYEFRNERLIRILEDGWVAKF